MVGLELGYVMTTGVITICFLVIIFQLLKLWANR